jgi:hypothetical protein
MTTEPLDLDEIKARDRAPVDVLRFGEVMQDRRDLVAEVDRLRDEITDRANVEADLRAQLAETKARLDDIEQSALERRS